MHNSNIPSDRELPSTGKLIKSTLIAAAVAVVLLITVVMPAEYGIDPTGIGKPLGLKRMGEIKVALAKEAEADTLLALNPAPAPMATADIAEVVEKAGTPIREDQMQVTLAPDEGTEIKVSMSKGDAVKYKWATTDGKANYDVHGDSRALKINYHSYEKGSEVEKAGTVVAAFDGSHGWFWRNRTSQTMTITLQTSGTYTDIQHMK